MIGADDGRTPQLPLLVISERASRLAQVPNVTRPLTPIHCPLFLGKTSAQIARVAERLQDKEAELEAYREEARYADESIPVFINLDLLNQDQLLTRMGSVAETYRKGGNKTRAQELINKVLKYRPEDKFALEVQRKLDEE